MDFAGPAAVGDLAVVSRAPWSVGLKWTAPADAGASSRGAYYQFRIATLPITNDNWPSANINDNTETPAVPGAMETFAVGDLSDCTQYWIALRTADRFFNWSELSNIATIRTPRFGIVSSFDIAGTTDLAVDTDSTLYGLDVAGRIWTRRPNGPFGPSWGSPGSGDGQLASPTGFAVRNGRVFVADRLNDRIVIFDVQGVYQESWHGDDVPGGPLLRPADVVVDKDGNVYVADSRGRVVVFGPGGVFQRKWGEATAGQPAQLIAPASLVLDRHENVWVVDEGNFNVQVFGRLGDRFAVYGGYGSGNGRFQRPRAVAIDAAQNILVSDLDRHDVQRFSWDGTFQSKWGGPGFALGQFQDPTAVVSTLDGTVMIAEATAGRVQVFGAQPPDSGCP